MAFFSNGKKPELKEETRMRLCAPSFSFKCGTLESIWTLRELKSDISLIDDRIVIIHPGVNMVMNIREWMKVLSHSYYLVVCYPFSDSTSSLIRKEADKSVYSLVPKKLTGCTIAQGADEAENIVSSIIKETGKRVITINNTEGELQC